MKRIFVLLLGLSIWFEPCVSQAAEYPVTIKSCNRQVVFDRSPMRAVSQDVNLTEMMTSLGLQGRMVGYTGVTGWNKPSAKLMTELEGLPELATHYPTVETLLSVDADFFFAGWNYGMRVGGDVTPGTLAPLGVKVYELSESCAQIDQVTSKTASLEQVYQDLTNLGKIFDVSSKAQSVIEALRRREQAVHQMVAGRKKLKVFVYDSGEDRAFTTGSLAIAQALIEGAGGINVMAALKASWTQVGWESVVQAEPDVIIVVDYGERSALDKERYLLTHPALQSVAAIRNKRFVVLPYRTVTPGIGNLDAMEILAKTFGGWLGDGQPD